MFLLAQFENSRRIFNFASKVRLFLGGLSTLSYGRDIHSRQLR